jgi:hypothetical protein
MQKKRCFMQKTVAASKNLLNFRQQQKKNNLKKRLAKLSSYALLNARKQPITARAA